MAQRELVAKQTIKSSGITFQLPTNRNEVTLRGLMLYLIFNEGYTTSPGTLQREICRTGDSTTKAPDPATGYSEIDGLLALMLLADAKLADKRRRGVDTKSAGSNTGDRQQIEEELHSLPKHCRRGSRRIPIQAAIAAIHDEAGSAERQIGRVWRTFTWTDVRQSDG